MYVCIENKQVISVVNYKPNVPSTVNVVEITDKEYQNILANTHYFDVSLGRVKSVARAQLQKQSQQQENAKHLNFLQSSDWKILRHIREKALGHATTLSDAEYIALETQRDQAASGVVKV